MLESVLFIYFLFILWNTKLIIIKLWLITYTSMIQNLDIYFGKKLFSKESNKRFSSKWLLQ